jgi:glycerol-3-phosphate acyltransferase PlsY
LVAYFIGATPTAYLAGRIFKGQDIRQLGDGNAGAANVARTVSKTVGVGVGAVDIGKGAAAVLLARWLLDSSVAEMVAGIFVIAGHNWPIYLHGRGGRGAATAVGVLLVVVPIAAGPVALLGLAVLWLSKSATKALAAFYIPIPFLAFWPAGYPYPWVAYSLAVPIFVGISHYLSLKRAPIPEVATGEEQVLHQG